jgi:hypothetical protein
MRVLAVAVIIGLGSGVSPATADIVSIRPQSVMIGGQVRVRTDTAVRGKARIDFGRNTRYVRTTVTRKRKRLTVRVPTSVASLLRTEDGAPIATRMRVRVIERGVAGRWARERLLVKPVPAPIAEASPTPSDSPPPPSNPDPTSPPELPAKRLLTASDLSYAGSFAMPEHACGWSTAWSTTGLAMRRVEGQLRFFSGVHVYSGGLVYETDFPGTAKDSWPTANVTQEWCDVYQGRKRTGADPQELGDDNQTVGLMFDQSSQRLYWSYGQFYNGDHSNDNALGYTSFEGPPTAHGPWAATVHSQKVRGGTLLIPQAFADAYLGGRRLGIGFGGYFNIIGEGSMGPALLAVHEPSGEQGLDGLVLMDHPAAVSNAGQWALRPPTYWIDGIDWAVDPVGGIGRWAPGDTVNGAAVWIDEPDVQGLLVAAQLQTGRIWYAGGGLHAEGDQSHWYIYDPGVLAEVAQGKRSPDSVQPAQIAAMAYPTSGSFGSGDFTLTQRISGMAYDSQTRTLFLLQLNAYSDGGEWTPLVHAYRLR